MQYPIQALIGERYASQASGGGRSAGKDSRRQWDSPAERAEPRTPAFMQPLAFVSSGRIQPDESPAVTTALPAAAAAATPPPASDAADGPKVVPPADVAVSSAAVSIEDDGAGVMGQGFRAEKDPQSGDGAVQPPVTQPPAVQPPTTGPLVLQESQLVGGISGVDARSEAASSAAAAAAAAMDTLASYLGVPASRLQEALAAAGIGGIQDITETRDPQTAQLPAVNADSVLESDAMTAGAAIGDGGQQAARFGGAEAVSEDSEPAAAEPAPAGLGYAAPGLGFAFSGLGYAAPGSAPAEVQAHAACDVPESTEGVGSGLAAQGLVVAHASGLLPDAGEPAKPPEREGSPLIGFKSSGGVGFPWASGTVGVFGAGRVPPEDWTLVSQGGPSDSAAQPNSKGLLPVFMDGCDEPLDLSPPPQGTVLPSVHGGGHTALRATHNAP